MTDHVLSDADIVVYLSIVDLEDEPDKVWQNCGTSCLSLDGRRSLTGLRTDDWQASGMSASTLGMCWYPLAA